MTNIHDQLQNALDIRMLDETRFSELRRAIFDDGKITTQEADMIFAIDTQIENLPANWDEFFVGAITDFLIRQTLPVGYVDPIHATWLMERIEHDDHLSEKTELELVLNVLRLAKNVPESLELYALGKVRDKIISRAATGVMAISEEDVDLIKRVLYASGGSGGYSICEHEARFLFDLDEISQNQTNHPSWQKLFVGAIANHVMTVGAPKMADAGDYRQAQEFLHSTATLTWNLKKSYSVWMEQYRDGNKGTVRSIFLDEDRLREAEKIDVAEATWLIEHINRDGVISTNEKALLKFFKDECPEIHESLDTLLRYAA